MSGPGAAWGWPTSCRPPADEEPRTGGSLAYHVLDIMESLLTSARSGAAVNIASTCERPAPVDLIRLDHTL